MKAQVFINGALFCECETTLGLDEFRTATELALGEALDQLALQGMHSEHRIEVREDGGVLPIGLFAAMTKPLTLHGELIQDGHSRRGKGERKRNKRDHWR